MSIPVFLFEKKESAKLSQLESGEVMVSLNENQYLAQQVEMAENAESDADLTDVELDSGEKNLISQELRI
jgi:hypothetical protein